jgi:hypothetical protein
MTPRVLVVAETQRFASVCCPTPCGYTNFGSRNYWEEQKWPIGGDSCRARSREWGRR